MNAAKEQNVASKGKNVASKAKNVPPREQNLPRLPTEEERPDGFTVGDKILELIHFRRLTVAAAADMVGMTRQQLFRIIQGDRERGGVPNPGVYTVQQIVYALGGHPQDLWNDGRLVRASEPHHNKGGQE